MSSPRLLIAALAVATALIGFAVGQGAQGKAAPAFGSPAGQTEIGSDAPTTPALSEGAPLPALHVERKKRRPARRRATARTTPAPAPATTSPAPRTTPTPTPTPPPVYTPPPVRRVTPRPTPKAPEKKVPFKNDGPPVPFDSNG